MADGDQAWLDFGRLMVTDMVLRHRARLDTDAGADGGPELGDSLDAVEMGDEIVAAARAQLDGALDGGTPFAIVAANAGLSSLDAAVLAVALTVEADPGLARLVAAAQGQTVTSNVTLGSLVTVLDGQCPDDPPVRRALLPDAPLRRAALLDLSDEALFLEQRLVVPHALVWAVLGDNFDDPDLPPRREYLLVETDTVEPSGAAVVVISGGSRQLRRDEAVRRCSGARFLVCEAPDSPDGWRALVRECTITGRGALVEVDGELSPAGRDCIERARHLVWGVLTEIDIPVEQLPDLPWSEHRVADRDPTDAEWQAALGAGVERRHPLTHDQLRTVGRVLPAVDGDLDLAVRRLASGRLEQLALRIRPTRTWDDIVLDDERMARLRVVTERYRHGDTVYGEWGFSAEPTRGLVALFSGPSGTGKTLASEIIAGDLGLDVFKLDLSSVVSKYIGETEKNLEEIFNAASAGDVVLFLDEADSLFGKRSEVRDARDRYANIEVSYLLQRLERYDGIVILATNFEKNIDEAFLRRIHVRVALSLPSVAERRLIWAYNLPDAAPTECVDVGWLAEQFELSGAAIRNAATHAAFEAAAAGTPITMVSVVRGVAEEFRKVGRLVREIDFGEYIADVG